MNKHERGMKALQDKKYDEALKWFNEAIEDNPDDPVGYIHFGDVLLAAGEREKAQNFYRKALELKELPAPFTALAQSNTKRGTMKRLPAVLKKQSGSGLRTKIRILCSACVL
ncbi:tetratricopeptide repeat protein [Heyndrickxia coagulans]|uniref:tetratricopeptide repeat protein n=1 Tax=Heyndrickxia coagulans TaxID=1398 RepID=UPI0036F389EE